MFVNVFVRASGEVEEEWVRVSAALQAQGVSTFASLGRQPHCTLFLAHFADADLDLVCEQAWDSLSGMRVELRTQEQLVQRGQWLFVGLERSDALSRLNVLLAGALAPLRDRGAPEPGFVRAQPDPLRSSLRANFERYGYPRVGPEFSPHLSLTATSPTSLSLPRTRIVASSGSFGVGLADDNGQVTDLLRGF